MTAGQMKKISARVRRRRRLRRLLLAVLLLLAVFLLADRNVKPLVFSLAEARSAAMASRVLSGAMAEALGDGVGYDELMNVRMDEKGQVALLSANTVRMNLLADRAGEAALRRLENMSSERVSVPLGAALGLTLLAGSGPLIPVSIVPVGSIGTNFVTEFEACGINQTRHRILIEVHAGFRILTPFGGEDREIVSTYPVTDTVIVGTVPERYAYIGGSGSDLLGEIRDYDSEK